MSAENYFEIGVVAAKRALKGPWASHEWRPVAVLPAAPGLAPGTALGDGTVYAGAAGIDLHLRATGHYRDNLAAAQPSIWVSLRPLGDEFELIAATVDPYQGEGMAEAIGDVVESLPMPEAIRDLLAAFVAEFHVEQPFHKRQRDRADPEALGRRGIVPDEGEA